MIGATTAEKLQWVSIPIPFLFLIHLSPSLAIVLPLFYPFPSLFLFSSPGTIQLEGIGKFDRLPTTPRVGSGAV